MGTWRSDDKSILVVEPDGHSRQGLRDVLVQGGHDVDTAPDAWQAIGKIRQRRFEVAIIDLDLPPVHGVSVNGWDLVRLLRAHNPTTEIILVSAEQDVALGAQARRLRVAQVLEKPISPTQLQSIVSQLGA